MRILLSTAYFPPDTGSAAHLFYELGTALVERGHEVWIVTSKPSYHVTGNIDRYGGKLWVREEMDGLQIVRVALPKLPRNMPLARGVWQISSGALFAPASLMVPRPDISLVYSPPIFLGFSSWMLRMFRNVPFILNVQDLFPQSVIDLGLLHNRVLIRLFEGVERFVYRHANRITVHSSGNKRHVIGKGVAEERVTVIPNWVDTKLLSPGEKENELREELSLQGKFVASFGGVLGYSQDLDTVLEAAHLLSDTPDIVFLIVGDGVEKERLQNRADEMKLDNVLFLPMQPRERYLLVVQASDVSLATLHAAVRTPVVPSKILSIMAVGKPVITALDLSGDVPELIKRAECGEALPPEEPEILAKTIRKLYNNPQACDEMGRNGREYAEREFSVRNAADRYEELFSRVLKERRG